MKAFSFALRGAATAITLSAVTGVGCAASHASSPPLTSTAPALDDLARPDRVLGSVDGLSIRSADLSSEARLRITEQENEAAQRRMHLVWLAVDEAVGQRLLAREAERRHLAVDELRASEIGRRVRPVTEDELREVYEANRDVIDLTYEQAQDVLRKQVTRQRHDEAERALLDELRAGADIRYAVEPPTLPRFAVDFGDGPSVGPERAKATVVVFADFQCPYCSRASDLLDALRERYPDKLRVVYRYFPLPQHAAARRAAEAAHCASEQDKFWPYHDLLYDHSQALAEADLETYAREAGLDANAFTQCLASERPGKAVRAAVDAGERAGVRGTPALYLNGIKLVGLLPMPLMQALIERELAN